MVGARAFDDGETYLSGVFGPVHEEVDFDELKVIEGEIPAGLKGTFARNASNPKYEPRRPYHWFDGDGMIHAVRFADGKARYQNRWVHTKGLLEDEAAGEATWGGLLQRPDLSRADGPYKNTANTDLLYWNDKLLALWWQGGGIPYEVRADDLATVGEFTAAGGMTAHAKVDPRTGDLVFIDYAVDPRAGSRGEPWLTHGTLTTSGELTRTPVELPGMRLQHDLALTERYTILLDLSMHADPEALKAGKVHVKFFREVPTRFGVFDRQAHKLVRWFEVEPCYIYHFANAWEQGDEVVVTGSRITDPLMYDPSPGRSERVVPRIAHLRLEPELRKWTLNLKTGEAREETLDDGLAEFARVDDRRIGAETKVTWLARFGEEEAIRFAGVQRVDLETGASAVLSFPDGSCGGEVSFAPLGEGEDEGVLVTFVTFADGPSQVWLVDAMEMEPVCKLEVPVRVPAGYHTRWIPGEK